MACALAPSLGVLIAARAAQGVFGAVAVAAALELLVRSAGRERALALWAVAGVLGAALGPAVGGVLTEALSWEAMFALQVPSCCSRSRAWRGAAPGRAGRRSPRRRARARARRRRRSSRSRSRRAALSAALFLLVILLIEGWRQTPADAGADGDA